MTNELPSVVSLARCIKRDPQQAVTYIFNPPFRFPAWCVQAWSPRNLIPNVTTARMGVTSELPPVVPLARCIENDPFQTGACSFAVNGWIWGGILDPPAGIVSLVHAGPPRAVISLVASLGVRVAGEVPPAQSLKSGEMTIWRLRIHRCELDATATAWKPQLEHEVRVRMRLFEDHVLSAPLFVRGPTEALG